MADDERVLRSGKKFKNKTQRPTKALHRHELSTDESHKADDSKRHSDENEEDDIEEEDDSPFTGDDLSGDEQPVDDRHGEQGWTLVILLILGVILAIFAAKFFLTSSAERKTEMFLNRTGQLFAEYFPTQDEYAKQTIFHAGTAFLNPTLKRPVVILFSGQQKEVECFSQLFTAIWAAVLEKERQPFIDGNGIHKRDFESQLYESLGCCQIAEVRHIESLPDDSPLILQAFADHVSAPIYPALIILSTVHEMHGDESTCEDRLRKHLIERWQNKYLNIEKIQSIVSRMAAHVVCLRHEQSLKQCPTLPID